MLRVIPNVATKQAAEQACSACDNKVRYTLATKLNSTRSTLLKVDKVDRVAFGPVHTGNKVGRIGNKVERI